MLDDTIHFWTKIVEKKHSEHNTQYTDSVTNTETKMLTIGLGHFVNCAAGQAQQRANGNRKGLRCASRQPQRVCLCVCVYGLFVGCLIRWFVFRAMGDWRLFTCTFFSNMGESMSDTFDIPPMRPLLLLPATLPTTPDVPDNVP